MFFFLIMQLRNFYEIDFFTAQQTILSPLVLWHCWLGCEKIVHPRNDLSRVGGTIVHGTHSLSAVNSLWRARSWCFPDVGWHGTKQRVQGERRRLESPADDHLSLWLYQWHHLPLVRDYAQLWWHQLCCVKSSSRSADLETQHWLTCVLCVKLHLRHNRTKRHVRLSVVSVRGVPSYWWTKHDIS